MKMTRILSIVPAHLAACLALIIPLSAARAQSLTVTTVAGAFGAVGGGDGTGSAAHFNSPYGIAVDASGVLYVADTNNSMIRKISIAGVVQTIAGLADNTGTADATGTAARFDYPEGIALDAAGNIYVGDTGNDTIRKITPAGVVTTLAGMAGTSGSTDGTGAGALFNGPRGLAADSAGNIYVADAGNNVIRKITPAGVVTTLAGTAGVSAGYADGAGASARFNSPSGVAVDPEGNLYVTDTNNSTIRKITPSGLVSTLAGDPNSGGTADGTGSAAQFNYPFGIALDGSGNAYVGDGGNNTIRKVTPSGVVTTLAGSPDTIYYYGQDGTGAAARFDGPRGIAVDAAGDVYIADAFDDTIRKGVASGAPSIGTPPLNQSVSVGNTVTLSVAASSATTLSYQWSFNGAPISGATSSTYTTRPIQLSDQGTYSVAVSNSAGTSIGSASVTATFSHDPTYSFDTWTSSTPLPTGTSYVAVAFDGANFLAVGLDGTAFYSPDGTRWTASPSNGPPGQTWGELNSVVNVPGKQMLVSAGNGGAIVTFASGTHDGTLVASGTTSLLTGVAAGNNTLVAVGYGGACVVSNYSATSWLPAQTGTSQNLNAVAYGNGVFVAVGLGGTVLSSPDGANWTTQNLGSTDDLFGVAFGTSGFVAVGSNGGIFTSPDGALWVPQISPTSTVIVHIGFGDGVFVAVGFSGTILTSTDGVTWISRNSGTAARLDGIALGNDSFVLTGTGGVVVQSGTAEHSRLINLSARSTVGTGGNILIAGFVVNGTGTKHILLRGVGPTLGQFGVSQPLAKPNLSLFDSGANQLDSNDAWGGGSVLSNTFNEVGAFALPTGSVDAALLTSLGAGAYTAELSGLSGSTGVGLAEIYDADTGIPAARLVNISARASVGTGGNVLIAGFVISGSTPEQVVIRGIGPTLAQFGVSGALATPQLVLYDSGNNTLLTNSGWGGAASLAQDFSQIGAFSLPSGSADAAIVVTLPPGAYTAELSGVGGATGVGLAEIYELP
jgi:sugar lactone lactonase YvrE